MVFCKQRLQCSRKNSVKILFCNTSSLLFFSEWPNFPPFSLAISDQKKCIICLINVFLWTGISLLLHPCFLSFTCAFSLSFSLSLPCPTVNPSLFSLESLLFALSTEQLPKFLSFFSFFFKDDFAPNMVEDQAREYIRQSLEIFIRQDFPGN